MYIQRLKRDKVIVSREKDIILEVKDKKKSAEEVLDLIKNI